MALSEYILYGELYDPRTQRAGRRARDLTERGAVDGDLRLPPIEPVERIERLAPNLDSFRVSEPKGSRQRQVYGLTARTPDAVALRRSERPQGWRRERQRVQEPHATILRVD